MFSSRLFSCALCACCFLQGCGFKGDPSPLFPTSATPIDREVNRRKAKDPNALPEKSDISPQKQSTGKTP